MVQYVGISTGTYILVNPSLTAVPETAERRCADARKDLHLDHTALSSHMNGCKPGYPGTHEGGYACRLTGYIDSPLRDANQPGNC